MVTQRYVDLCANPCFYQVKEACYFHQNAVYSNFIVL